MTTRTRGQSDPSHDGGAPEARPGTAILGTESCHAASTSHPSFEIVVKLELVYVQGCPPSLDHVQEYLRVQLNIPEPDDPEQPFTLRRVLSVNGSGLAPTLSDGS